MKDKNTFIQIKNSDVWNEIQIIKESNIKIKEHLDRIDIIFTNHLEHHKKFENNMKFYMPIAISIIFTVLQFIFYMLKK